MFTEKAILVTGCSTGIGYDIVNFLASKNFFVFAGLRKESDFSKFQQNNIKPLMLDVTKSVDIEAAYQTILNENIALYGIVNNAGIGSLGFLTSFSEEDMNQIFEVNTFGPWRVVNRFFELLVESKGRIVNIGSQGGVIGGKKLFGPYMMTKHALEVYTDTLRMECEPLGVRVSVIEPGGIQSEISHNAMEGQIQRFTNASYPFQEEAKMILDFLQQPSVPYDDSKPESEINRKASDPQIVSEAVLDALMADNPKPRYLVGTHWEGMRAIHHLMNLLLEVNDNPVHNFSLEKLIEILKQQHFNYDNRQIR